MTSIFDSKSSVFVSVMDLDCDVILPGGRDKEGRPIILMTGVQDVQKSTGSSLRQLLSVFR